MNPFWKLTKLSALLNPVSRQEKNNPTNEYRLLGIRLDGQGPFLREVKIGSQISANSLYKVKEGDFIYSRLFAWRGAFGIITKELDGCYVSGEFPVFNVDKQNLEQRFLFYWFRQKSTINKVLSDCTGSTPLTRNRFKEEYFLNLEIPLPSLSEQKRIVGRIEQLAAKIAEACNLRHQAIGEVEALTRSIGNIIFKDMANQFGSAKLETMTSRITKGESPEWQGFTYQDTGPLFIRSENVLWGVLNPDSAVRIPEDFHKKLSRSQLRSGDVLINLVGASIGRACVVPQGLGDANVNQAVAVITPESQWILSEFLVRFLLSSAAQETIHGDKVETARPNISLADMRDMEIPLVPLAEQRRIVKELEALQTQVDPLKRLQAETATELDALMPSVLDKAFKGEL